MKLDKLKGKMKERDVTQDKCSAALGISLEAFNKKVNGKVAFKVWELEILGKYLNLSDQEKIDIFLS